MHELPEYRNVMNKFAELLESVERARANDEYKNSKAQRAFAITVTNIEQARLWMKEGFYAQDDNA